MNYKVRSLERPCKLFSKMENLKLLKYLKIMYYFGYLPIYWIKPVNSNYVENKFKVTWGKSLMITFLDIFIALTVVAYFPVWHILNMGPNFDLNLLTKPEYYSRIFQGSSTSALTNLGFMSYPVFSWWIFVKIGWFNFLIAHNIIWY